MWEKGPWIIQENSCGNKQKSHNTHLKAYGHHTENVVKCWPCRRNKLPKTMIKVAKWRLSFIKL
jgi:hypothetical protein